MTYEQDKQLYWKKRDNHEFTADDWVVIQGGEVLKVTPCEQEALAFIDAREGMFVLYQVNHEDEAAEIDTIENDDAWPQLARLPDDWFNRAAKAVCTEVEKYGAAITREQLIALFGHLSENEVAAIQKKLSEPK